MFGMLSPLHEDIFGLYGLQILYQVPEIYM